MRLVVRAIFKCSGKVLVVRSVGKVHFFLPGGGVEKDEDIFDAISREILEEFGEKIVDVRLLCEFENSWMEDDNIFHEKNYIFEGKFEKREFLNIQSIEEELESLWIPISSIPLLDLKPSVIKNVIT